VRRAFRQRSRRGSGVAVAACLAALALPAAASAEPVRAVSAADFRDSIGVNTHVSFYDTVYGEWSRLVEKLDDLGIDHLRDGAFANPSPQWRDWNERHYQALELAAAHGKRFSLVMGEPNFGGGTIDQLIAAVGGRLRGVVDRLEGPNEYDMYHGGPNWPDELRAYQRELYAKASAHPTLREVPMIGPSLVFPDSDAKLGRLEEALDAGNFHPYTGGDQPSPGHTKHQMDEARRVSGSEPMYATEAGYHNALAATHGQPPVPEDVAASYLLRLYLEHFRGGVTRTYIYELIDHKPDPALLEPEHHFGLLRNNFSEKPAFTAIQRLLRLVGRPAQTTPSTLDLRIEGETTDVQSLLLKKDARHYTLALWQYRKEWDPQYRRRVTVPPRQVQLVLPDAAEVTVSRPARADDPILRTRGREVSISAPADPLLVDLEFPEDEKAPGRPAPPATPSDACPTLKRDGGVVLARSGANARVRRHPSRRRALRFDVCAATAGRAVLEIRGARGRRFARRKLIVAGARPTSVKLSWTRKSQRRGLAKGRTVVARVRYLPAGKKREVVLSGRLRVR
jgi:hypothetical protein